ncbi:MAG: hypothetical protein OEY89_10585 [Gammaproteobacteria bacterium]|nr:hypothetical protein [Gammaproteobacteria bacterium]
MTEFYIVESNAVDYKAQILSFWENYLPGTPVERFDWMRTNPAGEAVWFLAFEKSSNRLAGTVSIMPREIVSDTEVYRVGIMGDFMTLAEYRVFGPAMKLQKVAFDSRERLGLKFIYTVPNMASIKLVQRAGFVNTIDLIHLVKPLRLSRYVDKYFVSTVCKTSLRLIIPVIEKSLKLLSKETYIRADGYFKEVKTIDESFDVLWEKAKKKSRQTIGVRNSKLLNWKFINNPVYNFRVVVYKYPSDTDIAGYIIFTLHNGIIDIFDILSLEEATIGKLLKITTDIAKNENCHAIHLRQSRNNPVLKKSGAFMFFDAKNDAVVCASQIDNELYSKWAFLEGDKNS